MKVFKKINLYEKELQDSTFVNKLTFIFCLTLNKENNLFFYYLNL